MRLALEETVIALILYIMNDELFEVVEHGGTRDVGNENLSWVRCSTRSRSHKNEVCVMPVITVTLLEVYDEQTRSELCTRLTDAVTDTIAAPLDGVTVVINEVPAENYMRGRQQRTPGAAKSKT